MLKWVLQCEKLYIYKPHTDREERKGREKVGEKQNQKKSSWLAIVTIWTHFQIFKFKVFHSIFWWKLKEAIKE